MIRIRIGYRCSDNVVDVRFVGSCVEGWSGVLMRLADCLYRLCIVLHALPTKGTKDTAITV